MNTGCRPLRRPSPRQGRLAAAAALASLLATPLQAAGPAEFEGADLKLGERLIQQHQCNACHVRRVGGDGSAIYRPTGRISRPAALLTMVEVCSTELNLQLFPEDVAAVAAVLQRDHYRFK
ncbi:MAG: hypothetical protein Q7U26_05650 [Aquabacterium sp.]|nr:hypothetical protein [Aquabacterium sp.]